MKINSLFTLKEFLSLEVGHQLIRTKAEDQFLVSFPRSGNTWMRTMLAVLINPAADGDPEFTRKRIPGISISNSKIIRSQDPPRLIKSHTWYRKDIPRAVYLVRDGRDVMVSLYHYYITRQGKNLSFPTFFNDYLAGKYGQHWHNNVESWLIHGREELNNDLLVIKFEDLKSDTYHTLERTACFLKLPSGEEQLTQAIKAANLARMRDIEIQRKGPIADENESFYRGGKMGEWKKYFDPQIEKQFFSKASKALQLAGYLSNR